MFKENESSDEMRQYLEIIPIAANKLGQKNWEGNVKLATCCMLEATTIRLCTILYKSIPSHYKHPITRDLLEFVVRELFWCSAQGYIVLRNCEKQGQVWEQRVGEQSHLALKHSDGCLLFWFIFKLMGHGFYISKDRECWNGPVLTSPNAIHTRVSSHVPLQFVSVPAGVTAQAALEWTFSSVRANVTFQLADLKPKNANGVSGLRIKAARQREFLVSMKQLLITDPVLSAPLSWLLPIPEGWNSTSCHWIRCHHCPYGVFLPEGTDFWLPFLAQVSCYPESGYHGNYSTSFGVSLEACQKAH